MHWRCGFWWRGFCFSFCGALSYFKKYKIPVRAVTVNHNIREESETCGDAEFVLALGKKLFEQGFDVKVSEKVLERGKVFSVAEMRGNGVAVAVVCS